MYTVGEKEIVEQLKKEVAYLPQFDGKCYVCHKKFGKYFLFHHKSYVTGEKVYRDFSNTIAYNAYILPLIKKDPNRFTLLCRKHHNVIEKLKKFAPDKLERIFKVVKESK